MSKTFKVWVEVEVYDTKTGQGDTLDAPWASSAGFDSESEAMAFAQSLHEIASEWPEVMHVITSRRAKA